MSPAPASFSRVFTSLCAVFILAVFKFTICLPSIYSYSGDKAGRGGAATDAQIKSSFTTRQWDQDENAKRFRPSDWQMGPHLYISGVIREKDLVTSPITGRIDPFMSVFTTAKMASGAQKPRQNSKLPRRYQLTRGNRSLNLILRTMQ